MPGGDLLSRSLPRTVSSALGRFTAVCGMGTGGTAPLWPPEPKESGAALTPTKRKTPILPP